MRIDAGLEKALHRCKAFELHALSHQTQVKKSIQLIGI
jgi:hypothetical protein